MGEGVVRLRRRRHLPRAARSARADSASPKPMAISCAFASAACTTSSAAACVAASRVASAACAAASAASDGVGAAISHSAGAGGSGWVGLALAHCLRPLASAETFVSRSRCAHAIKKLSLPPLVLRLGAMAGRVGGATAARVAGFVAVNSATMNLSSAASTYSNTPAAASVPSVSCLPLDISLS